jgi:hypothetical protein
VQQGYTGEGEVAIITPYVGQLVRLRKKVRREPSRAAPACLQGCFLLLALCSRSQQAA